MNPPELYHRILDVPRGTSSQGLRAAYKGLARKWHPDKHPPASKPEAEARFKAITEAYEVSVPPASSPGASLRACVAAVETACIRGSS